jgi:hypothetical protein
MHVYITYLEDLEPLVQVPETDKNQLFTENWGSTEKKEDYFGGPQGKAGPHVRR